MQRGLLPTKTDPLWLPSINLTWLVALQTYLLEFMLSRHVGPYYLTCAFKLCAIYKKNIPFIFFRSPFLYIRCP